MEHELMETKDKLTKELSDMVKKRDITVGDLDVIYKAVKTIYYLTTMKAMSDYSQDSSYRNSEMASYMSGYGRGYSEARRGRDGDGDGRYNEGASYGFGDYRYSGHDAKEHIIKEMQKMMQDLDSRDQQAVKECISRIQ